jgi:GDPmannose 4,6-dehydratase
MKKRALITGISGQDGSYLSEYLLSLGYEVFGTVRRHSVAENQNARIEHFQDQVTTYYADLLDYTSLLKVIMDVDPHEIYNLAAMSHVAVSFNMPVFTIQTNSVGTLNLLEIIRQLKPDIKFYQASSSEMFGNSVDDDGIQRLTTPMNPVSPYGCSKLLAYSIVRNYRNAYKLHAANGILFNHESPRRGSNFVTNKVVKSAVEIKLGKRDILELGNLDSYRDWGHSKDYVRAIHQITNHEKADDFIVATGETRSVRELCKHVFERLDMNYEDHVKVNQKFVRPEELKYLKGDTSKMKNVFGWEPEYTFESMLDEMINSWSVKLTNK